MPTIHRQSATLTVALSILNDRGRIAAQRVFDTMGWPPA